MSTLEQIKNEVCQKHGMQNYTEFLYTCKDIKQLDDIIKEIVYLSQKECLKCASENAEADHHPIHIEWHPIVIKGSITNENNIIK